MVCCTLKTTITTDKQRLSRSLSVEPPNCGSSHNRSLRLGQIFSPLFLWRSSFASVRQGEHWFHQPKPPNMIKVEEIHILFFAHKPTGLADSQKMYILPASLSKYEQCIPITDQCGDWCDVSRVPAVTIQQLASNNNLMASAQQGFGREQYDLWQVDI